MNKNEEELAKALGRSMDREAATERRNDKLRAELAAAQERAEKAERERNIIIRLATALADRADKSSDCDHPRIDCREIGCIGHEIAAIREQARALASPAKPAADAGGPAA